MNKYESMTNNEISRAVAMHFIVMTGIWLALS